MRHILLIILCAFVLSCKSTKTATSTNESERSTVVQAQWRYAQNLSFSNFLRLTALSMDSCIVTFGGTDSSAIPKCHDRSQLQDKPLATNKAKPSEIGHGKPSSLKLYGLHLSHKEKEESVAAQEVEDSIAEAKQSSSDKSQSSNKSSTSGPLTAKLAFAVLILFMAAAIIQRLRRRIVRW